MALIDSSLNSSLQKSSDIKSFELLPSKWGCLYSSQFVSEIPNAIDKASVWFFTWGDKNDKVGTFGLNLFQKVDGKNKCVCKIKFVKNQFHIGGVSVSDDATRDVLKKLCRDNLK